MHRLLKAPLLFIAKVITITLLCAGGCTQAASPTAQEGSGSRTGSSTARAEEKRAAGQSTGLVQLVFSLSAAQRDAAHRPPWLGCQLHLLDVNKKLRIAADLGDGRRREFFPRTSTYTRLPVIFPFSGPTQDLELELHTTLTPTVVRRAPGHWGRRGRHFVLPAELPPHWAFSCVLRHKGGAGSAIDGFFRGKRPHVAASRRVEAADLAPEKMRAHLLLLLR